MVEVLRKKVSCSFEEAIKKVENALAAEKFPVLLKKDLSNVFKENLGIEDYPKYAFILGCKPELAKMGLDASKDVGTLFPCSFVVYQEEDGIYVAHTPIMKLAVEAGLASAEAMTSVIYETGKRMGAVWSRI
ncbi:DUF302 domain-containing protein [Candidatus Thorarchaeota archaeon]|nr:MAG: DUF302 domain-containing protein [Candidatus Thorarchaeota archaeon]